MSSTLSTDDINTDLDPSEGSFPFQFSWSDGKKVVINALLVAFSAILGYLITDVIPGLQTNNIYALALIPIVTAGLESLRRWLMDTRPKFEQRQLPYTQYLRIRALKAK